MRMRLAVAAVGLAVFGLVFLLSGRGPVPGPAATVEAAFVPVQRDRGEGGVEVEVLYATPAYARTSNDKALQRFQPDRYAVFIVSLNTHSGDLRGYDLVKLSELLAGGKRYTALRWESTSDDSHHRAGALIFAKVEPPLPVELTIKNIAGVPVRTFRWTP